MTCANCRAPVKPGQAFCGTCGAPIRVTLAPDSASTRPSGLPAGGGRPLIVAALLLGLLAGTAVFVWRMRSHTVPEAPIEAKVQEPSATPTAPSSTPPFEAPSSRAEEPLPRETPRKAHRAAGIPAHYLASQASADLPSPAAPPRSSPPQAAQEAPPQPPPPAQNRRRAVQENETVAGPLSSSGSAPASTVPAPANTAPVPPARSAPPVQPALKYSGPQSGVAAWTGKLEKGQILTITGGTPSTGVLSGAALPGVPVHITVDETNLGFAVMPNASNRYLTVAFTSHAKHDHITIHWTVAP